MVGRRHIKAARMTTPRCATCFGHVGTTLGGGVKISAFGGTHVAMHECMVCAIHIADMLCVCVRAQNDF